MASKKKALSKFVSNKDKEDVKNYSALTIKGKSDSLNSSKALKDKKATVDAYKGKPDSLIDDSKKAKMAYQKSWINKGKMESDTVRRRSARRLAEG